MAAVQVSDAQIKLAQDGDLEPLLKLLRHDDENVRALAAKAVSNLSPYQDNEVVLKGPAGYAPLLEMVKLQDDEVRSKAVWTIAILASNDENQQEVIKQIGWDVIMALIKDTVVEVQCGGVTLLGNLALLRDNKIQIINKGGVDVLMSLLKETRDVIVKRAIVTALSNIVDSDNAVEVIDDEGLDQLLTLLEKTDDERLLSGIVHTISNIANSESKKMNKKISKQAIERLVVLLRSTSDVIQKGTVMVFNGLSSVKSFQSNLFDKGAVKLMLELLQDSDDEELVLGLILCINNLSQNEERHKELIEYGVQEALMTLHDKTRNSDIQRECTEALDSLKAPPRSRSRRSSSSSRNSPLRMDGVGVKDNVKQIIKMLIKDPSLQRKLQKMGVIPQLVTLLKKEQVDDLKGHALDALTMLAMNNPFNQQNIALSNDNQGIRYVQEIIRDPYVQPQLLLRAVRLLGTLCWNSKIVQDVIDENNIARLVFLLESFDDGLKKASVTAVACIAEGNDKNQQILHKHRADKIVAQIVMLEREPNSLVAAGAHAIASLCRGNPKSQIICSRALGSLVMHLESAVQNTREGEEDHVVQEHLTDALFELCRNNKENKGILWRMHIVKLLIEILANADASPVTHYNSLGILWEYTKSDNKGRLLAGNKHLTRLLDPLCESDDTFVKDAAARLRTKFGLDTY